MVASRRSAGNRSSCQIRHMSANSLSRRVLLPTLYTSAGIPSAPAETHTHTQPFYGSVKFVWDNPGEPVLEETFTHSHSSWSSIIPICFLHLLRSMASSIFNPHALQSFSTISLQVFPSSYIRIKRESHTFYLHLNLSCIASKNSHIFISISQIFFKHDIS